jgi:hypothetical protein
MSLKKSAMRGLRLFIWAIDGQFGLGRRHYTLGSGDFEGFDDCPSSTPTLHNEPERSAAGARGGSQSSLGSGP